MSPDLATLLRGRGGAVALLGLAIVGGLWLLAQATGDVLDARERIAESRDLLGRTRAAAERPAPVPPLWAADESALLAAFRARLEGLTASRALLLDDARLDPDAARPTAPRLGATLRGTAEGLHSLLLALETQSPLMVVETADITVARPADAETGRPTVMQLTFALRGALAKAPDAVR
ncbi:type II secretion system protein GspM [Methylobacterium gossipiicola]|uniref:Type II secretion system (T2SS), protein M subtype b n=1 Tax=Methylobacterium gossipiicola TaxID=582675 RepID=A0A1I2X214_9HYPH|nr:type II secretion system protein GspM [Methylobacterium gossipiicola]SFH07604.1 Type II secretion system (T2SS), protein M subtype b [Methylobacterium gossipiicola]